MIISFYYQYLKIVLHTLNHLPSPTAWYEVLIFHLDFVDQIGNKYYVGVSAFVKVQLKV